MSNEVLDVNELMERVQEDKELLLELLDIFVEDYQNKRVLLSEAFSKNDFEQVKSIAHALKGASGNISAKQLREVFIQLEEIGKSESTDSSEGILMQLDKNFKELVGKISVVKEEMK